LSKFIINEAKIALIRAVSEYSNAVEAKKATVRMYTCAETVRMKRNGSGVATCE
jgi:hypothetical protein